MSMREKDQADFDIERMFEMLDTALTSKDERVQSALRALLTIITLTKPQEDNRMAIETNRGPLRQMQEDLKNLNRSLNNLREEVRQIKQPPYPGTGSPYPFNPGAGSPFGPYTAPNTGNPPGQMPGGGTPWWGLDPNGPWTTGAVSGSITGISLQEKEDK